jgi:RNA polymerase sigma factor (sigma-70 family)
MPATDVELSDGEVAELDEAARAGRQQAQELRARLAGGSAGSGTGKHAPAPPGQPIGGWVADAVAANAGLPPPDPDLVRAAKAGDPDARQLLVDRYLPLVVATARRYRTEGLDFTDLVQDGVVGLLRALEHFDPDRGTPFGAYARWWVRYSLQEVRRDFMRPLRLSRSALRQLSQLKTEQDRLHQAEGARPNLLEVAERVGMDRDRAEALVRAETFPVSLHEPVAVDEVPLGGRMLAPLVEQVADPASTDDIDRVIERVAGQRLRGLLDRLNQREREVLVARFGLDGGQPQRRADVAERLGVSVHQVRRIEWRALAKLSRSAGAPDAT